MPDYSTSGGSECIKTSVLLVFKRTSFLWLLVACGLLTLTASCNYFRNVGLLLSGSTDEKEFVDVVPFQYKKGLIIIEARIAGNPDPYAFIFDTGAFNSKIEHSLAEQLDLPTKAKKKNSDTHGNERDIEVTQIPAITIGKTTFTNIGAGKVVYDARSASPCLAKHGIIGANLIKLAHWKIDYQRKLLHFSDKPFDVPETGDVHKLSFKRPVFSAVPSIELHIGDRTVSNLTFDVGSNSGLVLPGSIKSAFSAEEAFRFLDQSISGIYGTAIDTFTVKPLDVKIDRHSLGTLPIAFSSNGKGLLGNDVLEHFIVYIDNKKNAIYLQPAPRENVSIDPFLRFIPGILNDSLWTINRIPEGGDAVLGDTLVSINGLKPRDLYKNHCDYFFGIRDLVSADSLSLISTRLDTLVLR